MFKGIGIILFLAILHSGLSEQASGSASKEPPPFFLQDPSDGMCLAGETFKRCGIDTLFYVVGSPGSYQIHKRQIKTSEEGQPPDTSAEEEQCLAKKSCSEKDLDKVEPLKLTKCTHCGAKQWNILGDSTSGYVLSENDGKTCVHREKGGVKALTSPCEGTENAYTPLQLQFASKDDIASMSSVGARLISAAADGDMTSAKQLITEEKVDVNARDWDELTALIPTCSSGHIEIVKFLIENGADVNAADKDGITALMEAAITGHDDIVELLLSNGANIDAKGSSEVTALWLAGGEGRTSVVKRLIDGEADVNNVRTDGVTALMTASANGHGETVRLLLEAGADPKRTDQDDLTCLATAAERGDLDVLKALLDAVPAEDKQEYVDHVSKTGFTALIVASAHGHLEVVKYLVDEAGAGVDVCQEESGVTALMYAAAGGHIPIMEYLIEKGADVNKKHTNLGSSLLEASTAGVLDSVKTLVEKGAELDIVDKDGVTVLMSAASQGHLDVVSYLTDQIKAKMSPDDFSTFLNRYSYSGGSALMFSAAAGKPDVTKLLIDHGSNVNAQSQATPEYLESLAEAIEAGTVPDDQDPHVDGVTALHVAAQAGHLDTVQVLLEAKADPTFLDQEDRNPLFLAVKGNHGDTAIELVKAGADPNTDYVDDSGEKHNLLMDAIIVENEKFANLLVKNGAGVYYKDENDVTTLLQASHRGMESVVESILLQHKLASSEENFVNTPSNEGITPLIAASSQGHAGIVSLLLQHSPDINAKDNDGTTALMAASARGHVEIVKELIEHKADLNLQNTDGHTALMFAYNGKTQVETLFERYKQFYAEAEVEEKEKVDDGGTGPIIEQALKNHTVLVDLLVGAGANQNLKDKEGHVAKDFDFHPDVDSDIMDQEEKKEKMRDASRNEL